MSIRHLDSLFDPASVAVIGASQRAGSVGATVWTNLIRGSYRGQCYAVNPKYQDLDGHPVVAQLSSLPGAPALALITTPPASVPRLIETLAALGTHAAEGMPANLRPVQPQ